MSDETKGERIAKLMARSGLCSRREAEQWVEQGRVKLDGVILKSPAVNVMPGQVVLVDGKPLATKEPPRLWLYHKPNGLVTSHKDEKGRATVFDIVKTKGLPRVISVGRLDLTSEGLLLLTNDGGLARHLELPSTGWIRRYRARVYGRITNEALAKLQNGLTIDGVKFGSIEAEIESQKGHNSWVLVSLAEGKNREVRRVFEHLGCQVNRLIRLSYGPFQLGKLTLGEVKEVPAKVLKGQLGAVMSEKLFGEG